MRTTFIPILGNSAWEPSPDVIANQMFATFFLSDYSQTALYEGHVSSFAYIMQTYNSYDILDLTMLLQKVLTGYYMRYFDSVVCEITHSQDPNYQSKLVLNIFLEYTSEGISNNISKAVRVVDGKAQSVIDVNNG